MKTLFCWLLVLTALTASAAVSDYVRAVKRNYNGLDGIDLVTYVKTTEHTGRAWVVKVDLTKGYRFLVKHGDRNLNRAQVGAMAEELLADGETPLFGMNGDYFDMTPAASRSYGAAISNSRMMYPGYNVDIDATGALTGQYFAETADGAFTIGVPTRTDGKTSGTPQKSNQVRMNGKRIRNMVRVNIFNTPVVNGRIGDIGHKQSRTQYPRPMIGLGTNELGHAMLVFFLNDGRHEEWSYGVSDTDSAQMMINEGCHTAGEFDGGGSAALWAFAGADNVYPRDKTAHGGYLNQPSDGSPRKDANGVFLLAPTNRAKTVSIGTDRYFDFNEAMFAAAPGETISVDAPTRYDNGEPIPESLTIVSSAADPTTSPIVCGATLPTLLAGTRVNFRNVALDGVLTVPAGAVATFADVVSVPKVSVAAPDGFEVAAPLAAPLAVDCTGGNTPGAVFGRSSLGIAELASSLGFLRNAIRPALTVAVAGSASGTELRWKEDVVFGGGFDIEGWNYSNRLVSVTVDDLGGHVGADHRLRLNVRAVDGTPVSTVEQPIVGTGSYAFDTAAGGTLTPGEAYVCSVELVGGDGQVVATADKWNGSFSLAKSTSWFSADPASGVVSGGVLSPVPEVRSGMYDLRSACALTANEAKDGLVRISVRISMDGGLTSDRLADLLAGFADNPPYGVLTVEERDDESEGWIGLTLADGVRTLTPLFGLDFHEGEPYDYTIEVNLRGTVPWVSYLVAVPGHEPVRLWDESGATWFASAKTTKTTVGQVECRGIARIGGISGYCLDASLAEAGGSRFATVDEAIAAAKGGSVALLTNVFFDPSWLPTGEFTLVSGGYRCKWTDGTQYVRYDPTTGRLAIRDAAGGTPANGLPSYLSYLLNLDADDPQSVPVVTMAYQTDPARFVFGVAQANGRALLPQDAAVTGETVSFALESAPTLGFTDSTVGPFGLVPEFEVPVSDRKPSEFYRLRIRVGE